MARADKILRSLVRSRFLVTLKTGEAFDGVLLSLDSSTLELVDAEVVTSSKVAQTRIPVDGRLYLQRVDVAYMQRVSGT